MRPSRPLGALAVVVAIAGCGPHGGEGDDASPDEARTAVRGASSTLVAGLESAGMRVLDDAGSFSSCGGGPVAQVEYGTGIGLQPDGPVEQAIHAGERLFEDEGWRIDSSEPDGGQPYVVASDGALTASVKASRVDEGVVVLEVQHACVEDDEDERDLGPEDAGLE